MTDFPEVTRSLRLLGSGRSHRAGDEARFFAPLLAARRSAADAMTRGQAIVALDARRLRAALDAVLRTFAAERHPERAPARRALEAELEDLVAPLHRALADLAEVAASTDAPSLARVRDRALAGDVAGESAANAPTLDVPDEEWNLWLDAVRRVFECADSVWRAVDPRLDQIPIPPPARKGKRPDARRSEQNDR